MQVLGVPPTVAELGKAIGSLASGKAPGNNGTSEVINVRHKESYLLNRFLFCCYAERKVQDRLIRHQSRSSCFIKTRETAVL